MAFSSYQFYMTQPSLRRGGESLPSDTILWRNPGTSLYSLEDIKLLEQAYVFKDEYTVRAFIEKNPSLISILKEIYANILRYFPQSQIRLNIFSDPDITGSDELAATVITSMSPEEALEKLNQFDENWWLDAMSSINGKISINVEFI